MESVIIKKSFVFDDVLIPESTFKAGNYYQIECPGNINEYKLLKSPEIIYSSKPLIRFTRDINLEESIRAKYFDLTIGDFFNNLKDYRFEEVKRYEKIENEKMIKELSFFGLKTLDFLQALDLSNIVITSVEALGPRSVLRSIEFYKYLIKLFPEKIIMCFEYPTTLKDIQEFKIYEN